MCDLSSAIKYEIRLSIQRNWKLVKQKNAPPKSPEDKNAEERDRKNLENLWDEDLISEIKNILT